MRHCTAEAVAVEAIDVVVESLTRIMRPLNGGTAAHVHQDHEDHAHTRRAHVSVPATGA